MSAIGLQPSFALSGVVSTVSRLGLSLKKGGWFCSDIENIPERMDTGAEGSNKAQALSATLPRRWTCVEDRMQHKRVHETGWNLNLSITNLHSD